MKNLKEIFDSVNNINDYKVVSSHTDSAELFYVMDKLETSRVEDVDDVEVTIYVDKDDKRGSVPFSIYPYMSEQDIINKINENIPNCLSSLNQHFDLPKPSNEKVQEVETNLKDISLQEAAKRISNAVFAAHTSKELTLNATEIFVYKITEHIINSQGVDVSSTSYKINIELIPTYNGEKESVEVYFMYRSGELDEKAITDEVEKQLNLVKARHEAKVMEFKTPLRVIIEEDDNVSELITYFTDNLNYGAIFQHINRMKVGESFQGENIKGDKINIALSPFAKGVCNSRGIDMDGIILHEVEVIKDGIGVASYGDNKFGQYLGIKQPTGMLPVIKMGPGTLSDEELRKAPYLRCVKFSSIQLEDNSGFFGGEVRLGFYFNGEKEVPVTGFTISGNMHEEKSTMRFSNELVSGRSFYGPKFLAFEGMKIN